MKVHIEYVRCVYCYRARTPMNEDETYIEFTDGTQEWLKDGLLHRDGDLPARIRPDGTLVWCLNGLMHRDNDLPARVHADGTKSWFRDGLPHRDADLPAVVNTVTGVQEWWQDGKLHRDGDLPACVTSDGTLFWKLYHVELRMDVTKPVICKPNGRCMWRHGQNMWQDGWFNACDFGDNSNRLAFVTSLLL